MLHNAKKIFYIELNTADKKKFWKAMKYLWKEQNTISVLSHNGSTAHNDNDSPLAPSPPPVHTLHNPNQATSLSENCNAFRISF